MSGSGEGQMMVRGTPGECQVNQNLSLTLVDVKLVSSQLSLIKPLEPKILVGRMGRELIDLNFLTFL